MIHRFAAERRLLAGQTICIRFVSRGELKYGPIYSAQKVLSSKVGNTQRG